MIDITKPVKLETNTPAWFVGKRKNGHLVFETQNHRNGSFFLLETDKNGMDVTNSGYNVIQDTAIEFTTWANVYKSDIHFFATQDGAKRAAGLGVLITAAPLKVRIDGNNVTIT